MSKLSYSTHTGAPDSEGIVKSDVVPQARTFGTFKQAVPLEIPDAPRTNTLMDLGNAMSKLNPALTNVFGQIEETRSAEEIAAAEAASIETQKKNVTNLKEAQAQGLIPDGVSPNFIRAWKTNSLKLMGERAKASAYEAYMNSGDEVRNSDDSADFEKRFATDWRTKYDEVSLRNGDANQPVGFTPLELHDSGYNKMVEQALSEVRLQHTNYRISEREKAAVTTAEDLIVNRITEAHKSGEDVDPAKMGAFINDVFNNPATGFMAYGGMSGRVANEAATDAIITAAKAAGDASILDYADHIHGKNGGSLSKTQAFKAKAELARKHITDTNWLASERERQMAVYKGSGVSTPEQVEQRSREDRARIEADYQEHSQALADKQQERGKRSAAEPEIKAITRLNALDGDYASPEIQRHLKALAEVDPESYRTMTAFLQTQARKAGEPNEEASRREYTRLRAQLSTDPSKFNPIDIIKAANENKLTSGQVSSLYDDYDKSLKTHRENPALSTPLVNSLRSDLRGATMTGEADEYGEGKLRSDKATAEFNALLEGYVRSNKGATEYQIYKDLQPEIEKIARKHNKALDQNLAGQERHQADKKAKAQEQDQMQERVGREVQELRSQPAQDSERSKLDAALQAKGYKNKAQRDKLIEQMMKGKKS